ncbi:MAG TPA: cobalt transporter CbiM [Bryobacteraceae bacterium]|jgi:cobalt/nickel transport system permease protein|nr:cobalt transporter CbiM [Bryobacteraceae bacterium]
MHIPDGYLSPATCATLFAGSAPFWYLSLRKMKRALNTRVIPLISVFAASSFIIMMFNLPLPGGTTGHAVGVGISTIVLGPWASILALSTALAVQSVFFGDGGITALGANCFNMAIVGSLAAYGTYRLLAGRSAIQSPRRVIAAAVAGYLAINLSAFIAALEFGIQPLLYHDSSGAPLYAPYPLHIAIPAMMIGHLTIAGLAEMVVSAGAVAYLQRAEPQLLRSTAPDAIESGPDPAPVTTRPLWAALALFMVLTPLGILAAGSAWGEWAPRDFSDPAARSRIASTSSGAPLPGEVPAGLQKLAAFWTAPMPRYAPPLLKSAGWGYLLSAITGTGIIILLFLTISRLIRWRTP